jgi:hypothetical protein
MNNREKEHYLQSFGLVLKQDGFRNESLKKITKKPQLVEKLCKILPITFMFKQKIEFRIKQKKKLSVNKTCSKLVNGDGCKRLIKKRKGMSQFFLFLVSFYNNNIFHFLDYTDLIKNKLSVRINKMSLTDINSFKVSSNC